MPPSRAPISIRGFQYPAGSCAACGSTVSRDVDRKGTESNVPFDGHKLILFIKKLGSYRRVRHEQTFQRVLVYMIKGEAMGGQLTRRH